MKILGVSVACLVVLNAAAQGPARPAQNKAVYEGKSLEGPADTVRLFYLTHGETPQDAWELANVLRNTADIDRISVYGSQRTLALRGTGDQVALAEWLFSRLDKPVDPQNGKPAAYDYPSSGGAVEAVRVFYFAREEAPEYVQQMVNLLRTVVDPARVFSYSQRRAIILRGTPAKAAAAEWLFAELDKASPQAPRIEAYQEPGAGARTDAVRLFFFGHNESPQDLQAILQLISTTAQLQRVSLYGDRRSMALRGTPSQIALAEWLFRQLSAAPGEPVRPN